MLQGLVPSLEHQPRASAARLMALYTPDWWRSNPFLHSERYATQTLLGMFSVLANSVQLSPQLGGVRNGEMENVTRVPPRLLPQSNPRSPLPLVVVGRTISPAPARPGEGAVTEHSRGKLPDARLQIGPSRARLAYIANC